jgi:hypothetical protein
VFDILHSLLFAETFAAVLGSTTTHIVISEADLLTKSISQENHRLQKDLAAAQSLAGQQPAEADASGSGGGAAPSGRSAAAFSAGAIGGAAAKKVVHNAPFYRCFSNQSSLNSFAFVSGSFEAQGHRDVVGRELSGPRCRGRRDGDQGDQEIEEIIVALQNSLCRFYLFSKCRVRLLVNIKHIIVRTSCENTTVIALFIVQK